MARRGIINKEAARKAFEQSSEKKSDDRFYKPTKNSAGEISVRIRLLPAPDTPTPIVSKTSHWFQENGTYSERCHTDIGERCPVCETQSATWDRGDKAAYRRRKKKVKYICNILVIKDPVKPENNGKVFLWEFTNKLYKKIQGKINPASDSLEEPCIVFDYDEGADFNLIGIPESFENDEGKLINYFGYDNSNFQPPKPLEESVADKVDEVLFDLKPFISPDNFSSYEAAKKKFDEVAGNTVAGTPVENIPAEDEVKDSTPVKDILDDNDGADDDDDFIAKMKASIDD